MGERFRIGRVVARSFSIWGRELPLLLAIALVVHAPRVASVELVDLAVPEFPSVDAADGSDRGCRALQGVDISDLERVFA